MFALRIAVLAVFLFSQVSADCEVDLMNRITKLTTTTNICDYNNLIEMQNIVADFSTCQFTLLGNVVTKAKAMKNFVHYLNEVKVECMDDMESYGIKWCTNTAIAKIEETFTPYVETLKKNLKPYGDLLTEILKAIESGSSTIIQVLGAANQ